MIRSTSLRPVRASAMDNGGAECGYSSTLAQTLPEGSTWTEFGNTYDEEFKDAVLRGITPKTAWLAVGWAVLQSDFPGATWEVSVKCRLLDPETGEYLTPEGTGEADLVGTLPSGGGLVVVDLKSGFRPVAGPNENWQIRGYGTALCIERGASKYLPIIWQPNVSGIVRGRWHEDGEDFWQVIRGYRRAAMLDPELPIVGDHCMKCYQSRKCRAYMVPDSLASTELAPLTGAVALDSTNALAVLRKYEHVKDVLRKLEKTVGVVIRDFARAEGGIVDEAGGKVWGPVNTRERRSVSLERVQDSAPDLYEALEARGLISGGGYGERYSWTNLKGSKARQRAMASEGDYVAVAAVDRSDGDV